MRKPFDWVFSETRRFPISIGSILGMPKSGIPFTNEGRSVSMLVIMQPFKFGSFLWQTCKKLAAKNNWKKKYKNCLDLLKSKPFSMLF